MIIPYVIACPECIKEGVKDSSISFDTEDNKYVCGAGHETSQDQFDALYNVPSDIAPPPEVPAYSELPPDSPLEPEKAKTPEPVQFIPADKVNEVLHTSKELVDSKFDDIKVTDILNVNSIIDSVIKQTSMTVPGGDLLIVVRIPEAYVGAIKAHADSQRMSAYEYFNQVLQEGIQSGWFV
jgi:hypothetical protein